MNELPLSGFGSRFFLEGLMVWAMVSPTFLPNSLSKTVGSLVGALSTTFGSGNVRFGSGMGIPPELIEKVNQLQNMISTGVCIHSIFS